MKTNVLITSAGQRVALVKDFQETLKQFFPDGKVYTTDMNPKLAPAAYVSDGCFEVPRCTSEDYVESLLTICLGNGIGLIVPTIDTELAILFANKEIFSKQGITVSVSDYDFVMMCRDKRNTGESFEKHGIRVPKAIDKYHPTFPLFAKPYDGSLSTNLHYIKNAEELTEATCTITLMNEDGVIVDSCSIPSNEEGFETAVTLYKEAKRSFYKVDDVLRELTDSI